MEKLKRLIRDEAQRLGFSHCGFTRNDSLEAHRDFYTEFIERKGHASLAYLETYLEKRLHPELVVAGTKSVVALMMNYFPPVIIPEADNYVISKYAYGADYHAVMKDRLKVLTQFIKSVSGCVTARAFVDSGVVAEKTWAQKCGVGWQGKNTLIINKMAGSFFFIGIILTDLEIEPDEPETDHCGTCNKCVNACPTGALNTPYQLDIPRCISYLTIESEEEIPPRLKDQLNNRIYGCDICQDVCPYNRFSQPHNIPAFLPPQELMNLRKTDWVSITEQDFERIFAQSAVKRAGYQRLRRGL